MLKGRRFSGGRLVCAALAVVIAAGLAGCASAPPAGKAKTASAKKAKPAKAPKTAVNDADAAIAAGKEACLPISETYANEHWRAQNQRGVWRIWVTPVHCEGGGTCPTYEVHVTAADGVASGCVQRIATY